MYHNRWDVIFDFTEKKEEGSNVNFTMLSPEEFNIFPIHIEGDDFPVSHIPIPQKYGGELPDNDLSAQSHHGMAEFSIMTSQEEA